MIERLQRALQHIEEVRQEVQEELAELIEQHAAPLDVSPGDRIGAWRDLPDTFAEMLERLERTRHTSLPTPPILEQLARMDMPR